MILIVFGLAILGSHGAELYLFLRTTIKLMRNIHFKTPHGEIDGHLNLLKIKNRLTIFKIFLQYFCLNYRSYLNDISPKSIDKRYFEYE